jgi:hypothetical protein
MIRQLSIDRLTIDAPEGWPGSTDLFRRLLEEAIREELRGMPATGALREPRQALRLTLPPVTVDDIYDLQQTAREAARRIVQAVRQSPQTARAPR